MGVQWQVSRHSIILYFCHGSQNLVGLSASFSFIIAPFSDSRLEESRIRGDAIAKLKENPFYPGKLSYYEVNWNIGHLCQYI
jgi:hypothetical protein